MRNAMTKCESLPIFEALEPRVLLSTVEHMIGSPEQELQSISPVDVLPKVIVDESSERDAVANQVIIVLAQGHVLEDVRKTFLANGLTVLDHFALGAREFCLVDTSSSVPEVVDDLLDDPAFAIAEPNYLLTTASVPRVEPTDESFVRQKALDQTNDIDIDAPEAWYVTQGSSDVVIAVVDTGVDFNHPDLDDNIWINTAEEGGIPLWDDDFNGVIDDIHGVYISPLSNPPPWTGVFKLGDPLMMDDDGHGTHVAGIIAAEANNETELPDSNIVGVAPQVRIMPVKVSTGPFLSPWSIAEGISYAARNGADVINLSIEVLDLLSLFLWTAIAEAESLGVTVVAASGNSDLDSVSFPAGFSSVIAVGAINRVGERCDTSDWGADLLGNPQGSNYGADLHVVAPGHSIESTFWDDTYKWLSGTSQAAPHVAGIAGLLKSVKPSLLPGDIRSIISRSAQYIEDPNGDGTVSPDEQATYDNPYNHPWNKYTGYGLVNARSAVALALYPSNPSVIQWWATSSRDTEIRITFSEDIDESTIASNVSVSGSSSETHAFTFSFDYDNHRLSINPANSFIWGETVQITLSTGLQDLGGQPLELTSSFEFTVRMPSDEPEGSLLPVNLPVDGAGFLELQVRYSDDTAISTSSIDSNDVLVTGPDGYSQPAVLVDKTSDSDTNPIEATYRITPPGGTWDAADNGMYTISMRVNQISDTGDPPQYVASGLLGTFNVDLAQQQPSEPQATLISIDPAVDGATSLRLRIEYSDDTAIDASSIDINDIRVTGPGGYNRVATVLTQDSTIDTSPIVAAYRITPPGGAWDATDNGTYTISMQASEVSDTGSPAQYVAGGVLDTFNVDFAPPQTAEIELRGNGYEISDGDTTPRTADNTDFGNVITGGSYSRTHTFRVHNTGGAPLDLIGSRPLQITGPNASDFAWILQPSGPIAPGDSATFDIRFRPGAEGVRTATITIANSDSNEDPYDFEIRGTGELDTPEMRVEGNDRPIDDNDTTPDGQDGTHFGSAYIDSGTVTRTFFIENTGDVTLHLTDGPPVSITGDHASDFTVFAQPETMLPPGGITTFQVQFNPSGEGDRSATISIANDDSDKNPYDFAILGVGETPQATGAIVDDFEDGDFTSGIVWTSDGGTWETNAGTGRNGSYGVSKEAGHNAAALYTSDFTPWVLTGEPSSWVKTTSADYGGVYRLADSTSGRYVQFWDNSDDPAGRGWYAEYYDGSESTRVFMGEVPSNEWVQCRFSLSGTVVNFDVLNVPGGQTPHATIDIGSLFTVDTVRIQWNYNPCYWDDVTIAPEGLLVPEPEIDVSGNGQLIVDGDATPDAADHTYFDVADVTDGSVTRTFTITNTGPADLNLTGSPDKVAISGANAGDFEVVSQPVSPVGANGGQRTFEVTFDPSGMGLREATISIANDDSQKDPYDFNIQGIGSLAPVATSDTYSTDEDTELSIAAPGVLDNDDDMGGDPLSAVFVSGPDNPASFTALGFLPGESLSITEGISGDGSVVVGYSGAGSSTKAFRWSQSSGITGLGDSPHLGYAYAASFDGSIVGGVKGDRPCIWIDGELIYLADDNHPMQPAAVQAVSADGTVLAGSGRPERAFMWTAASGIVELARPADADITHGMGISGDGSIIVGECDRYGGKEATAWSDPTVAIPLGDLDGGELYSRATGISAGGTVIVGQATGASGREASRWTSLSIAGLEGLGDLPGGAYRSHAWDASGDGSIIVGYGTTPQGLEAFIWDQTNGMRNLKNVLENDYGLDLTGWILRDALGVSDDGTVIAGWGKNPTGGDETFVAVIPDSAKLGEASLMLNADGSFTYMPADDFSGTDTFTYRASGGNLDSAPVTVTITVDPVNDSPSDIDLSSSSVAEHQPVGTDVGALSTTDPDVDDVHDYTLVSGAGYDDNDSFTIDGDTLKTAESFDFGTKSTYSILVRSTDVGGLWVEDAFTVTVDPVDPDPWIVSWGSAADHGALGEVVLPIPDDGTFSDPRNGGIQTLLVEFSEAINPANFTSESVQIAGIDIDGADVNLSGIDISTSTRDGDTVGVIEFSDTLPDAARYIVRVEGVTDAAGNPLIGDNDRIMTALIGDAWGDLRVNNTDLGAVRFMRDNGPDPLDPTDANAIRTDVWTDGSVNNTDFGGVRFMRDSGHDARFVPDPVLPVNLEAGSVLFAAEGSGSVAPSQAPIPELVVQSSMPDTDTLSSVLKESSVSVVPVLGYDSSAQTTGIGLPVDHLFRDREIPMETLLDRPDQTERTQASLDTDLDAGLVDVLAESEAVISIPL